MDVNIYAARFSRGRKKRLGVIGFTLVEMLVVMTISGVLATLAVPGFMDMLDKRRIEGPSEALYADMQFAKSEALKRGRPVRVVFTRNMTGEEWCYGLTHENGCDCTVEPEHDEYCYLDIDGDDDPDDIGVSDPVRINSYMNWPGVTMRDPTYAGDTLTFTPPYATANAGNVQLISDRNKVLRLVTGDIGRIRICSPTGSGKMWAYKACST